MGDQQLERGDEVVIPWGVEEVHGTVDSVYGPSARRRVVVRLTPELSDLVVDTSTTVVLPLDAVTKVPTTA